MPVKQPVDGSPSGHVRPPIGVRVFRLYASLWAAVMLMGADVASDSDWAFLNRESVDTLVGAYHDGVSGAFVEFELGMRSLLSSHAEQFAREHRAQLKEGQSEGWRYAMASVPLTAAETKQRCLPALGSASAEALAISFVGDDPLWPTWNFTAVACTPSQHHRIVGFLLGASHAWRNIDGKRQPSKELSRAEIDGLMPGSSWADVRGRLGAPQDAERWGDGFRVVYSAAESRHGGTEVWLLFGRDQKLAEAKVGPADHRAPERQPKD